MRIPEGKDAGCELVASGVKSGDEEADFLAFKAEMPADEPRWAVFELNFMKGGSNNFKIIFINYVPDDCPKNTLKFAYANHKANVIA